MRFYTLSREILPQVVVDDVTPILIDESDALAGALGGHESVAGQPGGGRSAVDLAVEIAARRFVAGVTELRGQLLDPVVLRRARGVEAGQGEEMDLLEIDTLVGRERDVDAVVRASFGDQRLRA